MKSRNYRTVLIEVINEDKFKETWSELCSSMSGTANNCESNGFTVVGLSYENEFKKLETLEEKYNL